MSALTSLSQLDQYRKAGPFPVGYPRSVRLFYAPVDDLGGLTHALLGSVRKSLVAAMYAFTDAGVGAAVKALCADPAVAVTLVLDQGEAKTALEAGLLTTEQFPNTDVTIGTSERGNPMHLKEYVVDGVWTVGGSTNWSTSGLAYQDNELVVWHSPVVAAQATERIMAVRAHMLAKVATGMVEQNPDREVP